MAERFAERWLKPRFILPALLLALVFAVLLSPAADVAQGGYLSTRSNTVRGSRGLRDVLDKLGYTTKERIIPYAKELDTTSTYVMLNTPIDPSAVEIHLLLEAVRRGARGVVVPDEGSVIADSIGVRSTGKSINTYYPVEDSLLGRYDPVDTVREAFGIFDARSFHRYLEAVPASDSDSAGVWPVQATTLISIRTPIRRRVHPEIALIPIGHGAVVAVADPTFFRNDVLRKTAGTVLAVRILESLDSTRRSPIIFDEYHQGFGQSISVTKVLQKALLGTRWGHAALQFAAAGLLYLLVIGVRPIAPTSRAKLERRSPLEHVGALSRAYEGISATSLAVQRLVRGVRRRHPLGTATALSDEGYLALLRVRLPKLGNDIDTLTRALVETPTAEQLVSAGAAIDHIERNIIT
ncbi:MAG: DUF4350 domain-containing protein [Gemmatimonadota bacterium]